jgi:hypothetical protein
MERVSYGSRQLIDGVHQSEAIIIYFTDGSILGIGTGPNVGNELLYRQREPVMYETEAIAISLKRWMINIALLSDVFSTMIDVH